MRAMNLNETIQTEWTAPNLFASKKDGSLQLYVEFFKQNHVTAWEFYPIPKMKKFISSLGNTTIFSTFDPKCGYQQVQISDKCQDKRVLRSHHDLSRFMKKLLLFQYTPGTYQGSMHVTSSAVKWQTGLAHLIDIVVFSLNWNRKLHTSEVYLL